jgi:hypothetical protein
MPGSWERNVTRNGRTAAHAIECNPPYLAPEFHVEQGLWHGTDGSRCAGGLLLDGRSRLVSTDYYTDCGVFPIVCTYSTLHMHRGCDLHRGTKSP